MKLLLTLLISTGLLSNFVFVGSLRSQEATPSFSIDRSNIGGGGGTSTGGVYSVSGSIGQPVAGTMSSSRYSLIGGFWSIFAVQTPGAPKLAFSASASHVTVLWPRPADNWVLEQSSSLSPSPIAWAPPEAVSYQTNSTHIFVEIPNGTGNRFFRLRKL